MEFEIDVSGEDLLKKNYTICLADRQGRIIKGFKFSEKLISTLSSRYGQSIYRYKKSQKEKVDFKIRLYCIVVYYLIKSIKHIREISLTLCRDFDGHENDIRENLRFFLDTINVKDDKIYFSRLSKYSNAHKYALLMRNDRRSKLPFYIPIKLEEFEKWLKK